MDAVRLVVLGAAIIAVALQTYFRVKLPKKSEVDLDRGFHLFFRGTLGVLLLAFSLCSIIFSSQTAQNNELARFAGYFLILSALALRIWAQIVLGANWSSGVKLANDHRLITSGPYRFFRHPMYAAYCMMAFGVIVVTESWLLAVGWTLFLALLLMRALLESHSLEQRFGTEFRRWTSSNKMLFPPVYLLLQRIGGGL